MPIQVVCSGCKGRFTVSDQFAGRTGPCPKCKQPIKVPTPAAQAVTIHEPEAPVTTSGGTGRVPTAPLASTEKPVSALLFWLVGAGTVACIVLALLGRIAWGAGGPPVGLLAVGAVLLAWPCVAIGYRLMRDRELEPWRGRAFAMRSVICAFVYAGLWGVRAMVPVEMTTEMWQWLFFAPIFCGIGALGSFATLDLEWGAAVAHFSLYVLVTAFLRWLAGLPPV